MERVTLILEDGTRFVGGRFGANHDVEGEVGMFVRFFKELCVAGHSETIEEDDRS